MKKTTVILALLASTCIARADVVASFDSLWTTGANDYDMPATFGTLDWQHQGMNFSRIRTDYGFGFTGWDGLTYSSVNNPGIGGSVNQYAVYGDGQDVSGTGSYAVYYDPWVGRKSITLPVATEVKGFYANNTAYAVDSILNGDSFARAFTTASNDLFTLSIEGFNSSDASVGLVDFDLADYTGVTGVIVDDWTWVDLTSLGTDVKSVQFSLTSTDGGTPTYFALDDLTVAAIPEPSSVVLLMGGFGGLMWFRKRRKYFFNS